MWGRLPIFWWVPSSCCVFMPLVNFVSSPQKPLPRDPSLWMLVWRFFFNHQHLIHVIYMILQCIFFPCIHTNTKKHIGKILEHSTYDHALQHIIKNIYHISTTSPCRKKTQKYPPFIMGNAGTIKNLEIFDELHFGNSSGVPWGCSWPSPSSPFSAAAVRWRSPEPSFRTWGDFMGK